jgi:hypothetical protein
MNVNGGYPTQARVAIYDTNEIAVRMYWFDTYRQALEFTKIVGDNNGIIVGTIDVVEVVA